MSKIKSGGLDEYGKV